jgi:DNA-binding IclR family transcriptional regulator
VDIPEKTATGRILLAMREDNGDFSFAGEVTDSLEHRGYYEIHRDALVGIGSPVIAGGKVVAAFGIFLHRRRDTGSHARAVRREVRDGAARIGEMLEISTTVPQEFPCF